MPFDNYPQYLGDILTCIGNIRLFRAGLTLEQIRSDRKTEAAIERVLQIISEAASRLGEHADTLCPGPDWRAIRGFGNILRHAYDRLDSGVLQTILERDLPALEQDVTPVVARLQESPDSDVR